MLTKESERLLEPINVPRGVVLELSLNSTADAFVGRLWQLEERRPKEVPPAEDLFDWLAQMEASGVVGEEAPFIVDPEGVRWFKAVRNPSIHLNDQLSRIPEAKSRSSDNSARGEYRHE